MSRILRLGILSDIHYAAAAEQARGNDFELRGLTNPVVRWALRAYRRRIWLKDPLAHNTLLDDFLSRVGPVDYVIAGGDYSCDSGFVGVSDDAAFASAQECLGKLRARYGPRFRAILGDHELGKMTLVGRRGGMRLASWERSLIGLGLEPFWQVEWGSYVLLGLTSSLVAMPFCEPEALPAERSEWRRLRATHLDQIRRAFWGLRPDQRVLLFCHDPTALPFLALEEAVRSRLGQIEQTIIGHLHTQLVLRKARWLAGMPRIGFLGHSVQRFTAALREARAWRLFRVRLCPSLAGIELLKDGGFCTAELEETAHPPARFAFHPLRR